MTEICVTIKIVIMKSGVFPKAIFSANFIFLFRKNGNFCLNIAHKLFPKSRLRKWCKSDFHVQNRIASRVETSVMESLHPRTFIRFVELELLFSPPKKIFCLLFGSCTLRQRQKSFLIIFNLLLPLPGRMEAKRTVSSLTQFRLSHVRDVIVMSLGKRSR